MFKYGKYLLILLLISSPINADIRLYGLEDFNFGKWVLGAGSLSANANVCVAVRPRGPYQITAYGEGQSSAFVLINAGNALPFRVLFNDRPRPNGALELVAGKPTGGLRGKTRGMNQTQCRGPNANIGVQISESDLERAPAGNYRGTIILIVGPE